MSAMKFCKMFDRLVYSIIGHAMSQIFKMSTVYQIL